jgi:aromatic-L-amino-acid decarboxylase
MLRQAFSLTPEYLRTAEESRVRNLMDYGVSMGRRFRALKLWMLIRSLGTERIADTIREHVSYAHKLEDAIKRNENFELLAPVPFSTVVLRFNPRSRRGELDEHKLDTLNERLLDALNQTGQVFLSHTKLRGRYAIRLTIGNLKTTWQDVEIAWNILQRKAAELSTS